METHIEQKNNNSGFFSGRASRDIFFWTYVTIFCFGLIIGDSPILIVFLALLIVISIRRAHDIGKNSWWLLWAIPFLPIILLVLFFRKGQPAENEYGKPLDLSRPFFERLLNKHEKMNSEGTGQVLGLKFGQLITLGIVLVAVYVLATSFSWADKWIGFYYPNKYDLTKNTQSDTLGSIDECRNWVKGQVRIYNQSGEGYDYECGRSCKLSEGAHGLYVCKETLR